MLEFSPSLYVKLSSNGLITLSYLRKIHRYNKEKEEEKRVVDYDTAVKLSNNYERSLRKTRKTIKDLCRLNDFRYFLTITFNQEYVDRYSAVDVHKTFKNVIKRLKYNYGDISYLQVPEFHDNGAIHYHLLLNTQIKPKLKYKGLTKKGQAYYTIQDDFKKLDCFLTIEKISQENPSDYLVKYITKSGFFPNKRKYGCSRSLKREKDYIYKIKLSDEAVKASVAKNVDIYEAVKQNLQLNYFACYEREIGVGTVSRYTPQGVDLFKGYIKDENESVPLNKNVILSNIVKRFKRVMCYFGKVYGFDSVECGYC